jgi:apolipoprotein N-acyltransferase
VIQPNISQDVKLDFGLAYDIVTIHESLSRAALPGKPQVIIWPETAVTTYLFESTKILGDVKKLVKQSRAYYLIGTPYRERDRIYNSVVAFSRTGEVIARYDKQRLVPFGEYLPMRPLFYQVLQENPLFAEDYSGNPDPKVIDLGIAKVGVVVCFESTFPYLVRDRIKRGAQFILVATNDAWFFDSAALYQHIQAARMRAVENRVYVVQAANTGISAVIDPLGRIVKRTSIEQPTVMMGRILVH